MFSKLLTRTIPEIFPVLKHSAGNSVRNNPLSQTAPGSAGLRPTAPKFETRVSALESSLRRLFNNVRPGSDANPVSQQTNQRRHYPQTAAWQNSMAPGETAYAPSTYRQSAHGPANNVMPVTQSSPAPQRQGNSRHNAGPDGYADSDILAAMAASRKTFAQETQRARAQQRSAYPETREQEANDLEKALALSLQGSQAAVSARPERMIPLPRPPERHNNTPQDQEGSSTRHSPGRPPVPKRKPIAARGMDVPPAALQRQSAVGLSPTRSAVSLARPTATVAPTRPEAYASSAAPTLYKQVETANFAAEAGLPSYNICGALALAHMTGTAPQISELYDHMRARVLSQNLSPEEAQKELYNGAFLKDMAGLLKDQKIDHKEVSVMSAAFSGDAQSPGKQLRDEIDWSNTTGVTFGFHRNERSDSFHYAALKKTGDQWWLMDSFNSAPVKLETSPAQLLRQLAEKEAPRQPMFDLLTVNRPG